VKAGKPIIGLAGGIGSGKTTVGAILGDLGAAVIASDRLNHEELDAPEVLECLHRWWGDEVIKPDGRADRDAIRKLVAGDSVARKRLERLIHPRITRRRQALMRKYLADPSIPAIVWDSPLLFEAGLVDQCHHVIFVEADAPVRRERVSRDRGWTAEDFEKLEKAQAPLDMKRSKADYKVVNNSDRDDLRRQVDDVFSRILSGN